MNILDMEEDNSSLDETNGIPPQSVLLTDRKELYKCFMPSIKTGGLFVLTNNENILNKIQPKQRIFILLTYGDQKQKTPINGTVVWINKDGINKGYGVSLGDSQLMKSLKESIQNQIAEYTIKKESTYTF